MYMFLNVGMDLPITRKQTCIFVLSIKLSAVAALAILMPKL